MLGFWWSENFKYTTKAVIRFLKLGRSIFSHNVLYLRYSTRKGYNIAATTPSVEKRVNGFIYLYFKKAVNVLLCIKKKPCVKNIMERVNCVYRRIKNTTKQTAELLIQFKWNSRRGKSYLFDDFGPTVPLIDSSCLNQPIIIYYESCGNTTPWTQPNQRHSRLGHNFAKKSPQEF